MRLERGVPMGNHTAWAMGSLLWVLATGCDGAPHLGSLPEAPEEVAAAELTKTAAFDGGLAPLSTVRIPRPVGGDVVNRAAAVRLGKIFFWEMQAGSDGQTACASCHFAAGVDRRRLNTLNPGPNARFESNGVSGPGQVAAEANIGSDDRLGSQGVAAATFVALASDPSIAVDQCLVAPAPPFDGERQVTPRQAPSVVGAVFYREAFWDGRAHSTFNGLDPFGDSGNAEPGGLRIQSAALASQAVGPPGNAIEMACAGRGLNGPSGLGAKLLARAPLRLQQVDRTDGVLGRLSAWPSTGLWCGSAPCTYRGLIEAAFGCGLANDAENQFSRIWGQALAAYEATLIPDHTPLDQFLAGASGALDAPSRQGLELFLGKGLCIHCHAGPELSDATVGFALTHGLINEDGGDQGFHHTGVRPVSFRTSEDEGRAGMGPKGVSFSISRSGVDRGAFKTPGLRNVKLTAPYFHNGGKATLGDVVDFYARGGDFKNPSSRVRGVSLLPGEREALVAFLENALTDCRTQKEQAPFDHPSLGVPNGPQLSAVGAAGTGACPP